MTLRAIVGWWRQDLVEWWQARRGLPVPPVMREKRGRMVRFTPRGVVMGRPRYDATSCRGGFYLGRVEYRNQWGYYAFYPAGTSDGETPLNAEIVAEIYAMLRDLK